MTTQKPDVALQESNYDVLRQRVADMVPGNLPGREAMASPELSAVVRAASQGVLGQLQEHGIREAGTLAIRLGEAAETDNLADLSYTVAGRYLEAQGMRESSADANAQAQQQRMALLASAAGETAVAIVGSVLKPDNLASLVRSGEKAVLEYGTATHDSAGVDLLTGLLNQAEAAQTPREPLAA